MNSSLMKLPKVDPTTIKKAKEFLEKHSKEIVVVVTWLLDKLFGKEELKKQINSLNDALNEAKGIIQDLVEQNEKMSATIAAQEIALQEFETRLKAQKRNFFTIIGLATIAIALLVIIVIT